MSFDVVRASAEEVTFRLSGVDVSVANGLRRIMIAEVPTLAIEDVVIHRNTTMFQDEYLAQRLGLIPLRTTCAPAVESARFSLRVCAGDDDREITSRDIVCETPGVQIVHSSEGGILLARLLPRQRLSLEATARVGTGKIHAKWSPVSTAKYRYEAEIVVQKPFLGHNAQKVLQMCPKNVFDVEDGHLVAARPQSCVFCGECTSREAQRLTGESNIGVDSRSGTFLFTVESAGQFDAVDIVARAWEILIQKCSLLLDRVTTLPPPPKTPPGTPMMVSYQD